MSFHHIQAPMTVVGMGMSVRTMAGFDRMTQVIMQEGSLSEEKPVFPYDSSSDRRVFGLGRKKSETPFRRFSLPELETKVAELCLAVQAGLMVELTHDCLF